MFNRQKFTVVSVRPSKSNHITVPKKQQPKIDVVYSVNILQLHLVVGNNYTAPMIYALRWPCFLN